MSIARLKKVAICGLLKDKHDLLKSLQGLGCMHLLPLRPAPAEAEKVASPRADAAYKALRFLTDSPEKRKLITIDPSFDVEELVHKALAVKDQLRDANDRRDFLEQRIAAVKPWGNIEFPADDTLAGFRLWFYILPAGRIGVLTTIDLPWQIVHKDHRLAYVVVVAKDEPPISLLPVSRTHAGALPLRDLEARLEKAEADLEDAFAERHAMTRYIYLLSVNLAEAENSAALVHANQQTRDGDGIVAVQGWVPEDALPGVEALIEEKRLACIVEEAARDEEPPTLIEQPPVMDAGVDLAMFYQVPSYRSWDPSMVLFFSFSVFFAMILADAGYGLALMLLLLFFWRRLGASDKGRAYRLLGLSLFGCSIIYGVMVGSYFGITPPKGGVLDALLVLDMNDYSAMMKLSIVIGVLHLALGNAIIAYINRTRIVALASLGWIAGLFGGLLLVFNEAGSISHSTGVYLLICGLAAVFLFSSDREFGTKPIDLLWRALDGVKALTGVMGMFGDVLSYMRLFALGLASASLALTFNNLAIDLKDAVPGLGLLLAILLLIAGHVVNLGLSIMSGAVHGLRLNFMEFYRWGMPEEGRAFRKFARKEVQS